MMNRLFHIAPISGEAWLRIVGVGLVVFLVVGLEKSSDLILWLASDHLIVYPIKARCAKARRKRV
jgi:hypothetical protein